jgi:hypothetical protein
MTNSPDRSHYYSLSNEEALVTLLVIKGVLTLQEAVNVTGRSEDQIIFEAEAWAAAEQLD